MNAFEEGIKAIADAAEAVRAAGDYETRDGIRYCTHCGKPVEIRRYIKEFDKELLLPVMCDCEKEAELRRKEEAHRQTIADAKKRCFGGDFARISGATIAAAAIEHPKEANIARNYVNLFNELYRSQTGLLLYGPNGTGKSFLAAAICNELVEGGNDVKFATFAQIDRETSAGTRGDKQEYFNSLNKYALLVLDDLGAERGSPYMQELVFAVIDSRYASGKPFIITTNLTLAELKAPANIQQARIYDRILQACHPVQMAGESLRRKDTKERYYKTKELLEA